MMGREPTESTKAPSRGFLITAVLLAAAVRIYWARTHGLAIEQEGVEYARIAQNLLAGRGYVGIFNNGTQLNFPPLYPILIAAVSLVVGKAELAARAINVALGALLVVPIFRIADRVHGRRVAVTAAVLTILHPVLIAGSASTYVEGPYLTLLMTALLWVLRWTADRRLRAAVLAGLFLGLAYLVRPEAFLFAGGFAGVALLAALRGPERRPYVLGALGLAGTFALLALPNVVFLTVHTGRLRIEAKGTLAYEWGRRMNQGMSYTEAANGIGPDLSDQGVFMRPNADVIRGANYTTGEYARFVLRAARRNLRPIIQELTGGAILGSPWLFALVVLGLFRSPWDRARVVREGVLLGTGTLLVLVLLTVQALWFRYFFSLLGVLLIWGARGATELAAWVQQTLEGLSLRRSPAAISGSAVAAGAIVLLLGWSARALPSEPQYAESLNWERARAGRWLAGQEPKPVWVMDQGLQVAYYAGANLMFLPYADSALALRYVAKRRPDYIVLLGRARAGLPYTTGWFDRGIPDPRARLVYDEGRAPAEEVKIYRWVDSLPPAPPRPSTGDTEAPGSPPS